MTGHSKKIAKAIAGAFGVEPLNVKENHLIKNVDLLFIVGGIYSGKSLPEMLSFVETLDKTDIKQAVLITSSLLDKNGQDEVRAILESKGIKVAEKEFRCLGNFLVCKMGHPNKKEVADAVEFAKAMEQKT